MIANIFQTIITNILAIIITAIRLFLFILFIIICGIVKL